MCSELGLLEDARSVGIIVLFSGLIHSWICSSKYGPRRWGWLEGMCHWSVSLEGLSPSPALSASWLPWVEQLPSAMLFLPWSQRSMDWILWKPQAKKASLPGSCVWQVLCLSKEQGDKHNMTDSKLQISLTCTAMKLKKRQREGNSFKPVTLSPLTSYVKGNTGDPFLTPFAKEPEGESG